MVDPFSTALIAGGSLFGAGLNYLGTSASNVSNREGAREQMAFQERMSNTSYQRAVADMKAAGINPMVAFMQGGASTPGGAMSVSQNPMSGASDFSHSARAAALEAKMVESGLEKNQSEIQLNRAAATREQSAAALNAANAQLSQTSAAHSQLALPRAENLSRVNNSVLGKYVLGPLSAIGDAIGGSIFGGLNSARSFFNNYGGR